MYSYLYMALYKTTSIQIYVTIACSKCVLPLVHKYNDLTLSTYISPMIPLIIHQYFVINLYMRSQAVGVVGAIGLLCAVAHFTHFAHFAEHISRFACGGRRVGLLYALPGKPKTSHTHWSMSPSACARLA